MNLYLAHYELIKVAYMGATTKKSGVRLVYAEDDHEAVDKMEAEYERSGDGSDSVRLWNLRLEKAL